MSDRDELARARYHALQRLARQQQRPTDELLVPYTLEGFLARLAASDYRDRFVLKGGVLLAAFGTRRPTRDLDVHARQLNNDLVTVRDTIAEIAAQPYADGLRFETATVTAQAIREEDAYSGVRVSLDVQLHTGRTKLEVDINVGDPIWPEPQQVAVPRLLVDEPIVLAGYPLHMVYAEKTRHRDRPRHRQHPLA